MFAFMDIHVFTVPRNTKYYVHDMDERQEDNMHDNIKYNIMKITPRKRSTILFKVGCTGLYLVAGRIRLKNNNSFNKAILYYLLHNYIPYSCPPLIQHAIYLFCFKISDTEFTGFSVLLSWMLPKIY